jgi:hypothetical protein
MHFSWIFNEFSTAPQEKKRSINVELAMKFDIFEVVERFFVLRDYK